MKKVFLAISMLAVAFGFTACSNEDEAVNSAKKGKATVVAFTENETRTALSGSDTEGYQVVWSEGDKITIGTETFDIDEKSIAGTTAKFTGNKLDEDTYTALYGINEMVWPSKQTYKEGNVANFPMYASATVDSEGNISPLSFKNLGGLLRLTVKVKGESTRKIKSIEVASDNPMAGVFTISNDAARITTKATINPINSIVLDCGSNGVPLSADGTDFYIALPIRRVGNYTGVKIYLTSTDGNVCVKTFKGENGLTITRSQITKASFTVKETEFVPGITANSEPGTVGLLNGVEGMVVELNDKKVVVATKNVGATTIDVGADSTDPKASCYGVFNIFSLVNYGGNVNFGGNGWRLPTKAELEALKGKISWSGDRHGAIWQVADGSILFLPAAGRYFSTSVKYEDVGVKGYYVCQRENFDINNKEVYGLWFDANGKDVSDIGAASYVVRAFHDMPTE